MNSLRTLGISRWNSVLDLVALNSRWTNATASAKSMRTPSKHRPRSLDLTRQISFIYIYDVI